MATQASNSSLFQAHLQKQNNLSFAQLNNQGFAVSSPPAPMYMEEGNRQIQRPANPKHPCPYCNIEIVSWPSKAGLTNWKCEQCGAYYGQSEQPPYLRMSGKPCAFDSSHNALILKAKSGKDYFSCKLCPEKIDKSAAFQGMLADKDAPKQCNTSNNTSASKEEQRQVDMQQIEALTGMANELSQIKNLMFLFAKQQGYTE